MRKFFYLYYGISLQPPRLLIYCHYYHGLNRKNEYLLSTDMTIIACLYWNHSCNTTVIYNNIPFKDVVHVLRTDVTNSQTFGGNSSNIDFVHILQLDKP